MLLFGRDSDTLKERYIYQSLHSANRKYFPIWTRDLKKMGSPVHPEGNATTNWENNLDYGMYQHYKGNLYRLLFFARDADTLEKTLVYQGQYSDEEFGIMPVWTRALKTFQQPLTDGRERYKYIGSNILRSIVKNQKL